MTQALHRLALSRVCLRAVDYTNCVVTVVIIDCECGRRQLLAVVNFHLLDCSRCGFPGSRLNFAAANTSGGIRHLASANPVTFKLANAPSHGQKLNLVVSSFEFLFQSSNAVLLIHDLLQLGVHVDAWSVADLGGLCSVIERRYVFLSVEINRRKTRDHQGETVAAKTLLQDHRKFRLPIRHIVENATFLSMRSNGSVVISERGDYLA